MSDSADKHDNEGRLEQLRQALDSGDAHQVRNLLSTLHSAEIADLLESIPHGPREILWELVDPDDLGETLVEVNDEVRAGLIDKMETDDLVAATEGLDADDLADLIQENLRKYDIAFRYGGEEFVVILPSTDETGAKEVAEHLRKAILNSEIPHEYSEVSDYITISLGVTVYHANDTLTTKDIIENADQCLYSAKAKGRNRVVLMS